MANLLSIEVDLLFLDTTSTYFEIEHEDDDHDSHEDEDSEVTVDLRKRSRNSKDKRPDLPQVVIGFAVTRSGIPVRCWVWPGNEVDQNAIAEVKTDHNHWNLGRVVMVQDTGLNSAENRRTLQTAGGHYIIGGKLRQGSKGEPAEALKRAGKYRTLDNGLEAKEVIVGGESDA